MPSVQSVLREEILRLARQEIRKELAHLKKQSATHRRDIAALKRTIDDQARELRFLKSQEKRRLDTEPEVAETQNLRFSAAWLKKHRAKLDISAEDYARLVGVSTLSIYRWENGQATPRDAQKAKLAAVRGLGKREALHRLELLDQ